jgi:hypothetical protein
VDFRKPLLLPSRVQFGYRKSEGGVDFGLYDEKHELTHLVGKLTAR